MILQNWYMDAGDWHAVPCVSPCSMYSVLKDAGLIPDPYYGTNEEELTPLSELDCTFSTTFEVTADTLAMDHVALIFHGLDTICDIDLNGARLDSVMNMHRTYRYEVKSHLTEGTNTLRLTFHSPLPYFREMNNKHYLYTNGESLPGAAHLRKALFMSGWDWAPTLPNMGIFRPVELAAYFCDRLEDMEILQYHEEGRVRLSLSATTVHAAPGTHIVATVEGKTVTLTDGRGEYLIEEPRLWWPNGFGAQPLYEISFSLYRGEILLDSVSKQIGLRTLTLSTAKLTDGNEFCFVVNGVKIFAMGANYVPLDSLLSTITRERLFRLVEDCKFANFNCLRVWGGAYYPEDDFYEACDRAGLIVWQDFMLACINVWMRPDFEGEVMTEATEQIKRIRHHACLGLLCGNNEMELFVGGGNVGKSMLIKTDYLRLYEQLLPALCEQLAPQVFYLPSSPTSGGGFDEPNASHRGDVHFWSVWSGGAPFTEYRKHRFRFCSEYGFQSMPSIKTVDSFCPPEERNLLSYTMESHQKQKNGNRKFLQYLADEYLMPCTMENLVYATQLNQANAIKYGVEHFRRTRPYCMGSIYWQLNDCWPVCSWSSIDYNGRYKALHYFARKFYAPVALALFAEKGHVTVNVANETRHDFRGTVKVGLMKQDFTPQFREEQAVCVGALRSEDVTTYDVSPMVGDRELYFYADLYDEEGHFLMRQTELGVKPKHVKWRKPDIRVTAAQRPDGVALSFSSDVFAKAVQVDFAGHDIRLSDNYFDLATAEPYTVLAETSLPVETLLEDIRLRCIYHIPLSE